MLSILWNVAAFVVVLGILVTVHEFGHFWVARRCGVKVLRFSIGFGKALWRRIGADGTEYVIAMIPLGGYVKMLDGRVDTLSDAEHSKAFDQQRVGKRMAIVAAGPIANFLLAFVAYWIVFMMGVPAVRPIIAEITPHSIAAQAGMKPGMEVLAIGSTKTPTWDEVNQQLVAHIGDDSLDMVVRNQVTAPEHDLTLDLSSWEFDPDRDISFLTLGMQPKRPTVSLKLAEVVQGSPAAQAGFKIGDTLVAINDKPLEDWFDFVKQVQQSPNNPLQVTLLRDQQRVIVQLIPASKTSGNRAIGFAGVQPNTVPLAQEEQVLVQYGPIKSLLAASEKTYGMTKLTLVMIGKLMTGAVSVDNLGGPIAIAKGAGASAGSGFIYFLLFLALISINLGIVNLIPLPVLDGGHLLFFIVEAITGKPVPEKFQEYGFRVGVALLVCLMGIALLNDFARL